MLGEDCIIEVSAGFSEIDTATKECGDASICVISTMHQTHTPTANLSLPRVHICRLSFVRIDGDPDHYTFTLFGKAQNGTTTECIAFCR